MSIQAGWLAVKGLAKRDVLERLGLVETDETAGWDDFALSCTERPGGWTVVLMRLGDLPRRPALEALSAEGEVVTCAISEVVMAGEAQGFAGGRRAWWIQHDGGSKGNYDLTVEGEPPAPFEEIRARLFATQAEEGGETADVDYVFDLPAELVFALCGFRADGQAMADEPVMTVLERAGRPPAAGGGLLKTLVRLLAGR